MYIFDCRLKNQMVKFSALYVIQSIICLFAFVLFFFSINLFVINYDMNQSINFVI